MNNNLSQALKEIQELINYRVEDAMEREEHNKFRSLLKMHYFIKACKAWEPNEIFKWFQKEWQSLEKEELVQMTNQLILALMVEENKEAFKNIGNQLAENYEDAFEKEGIS